MAKKRETRKDVLHDLKKISNLAVTGGARFPVVALGASAGGLEDFEKFFRNVAPESGIAYILIPHLEPSHQSLLPEIIQRSTKMNVVQAKDRMRLEPNRVYIIPPNKNMEIFGGVLRLFEMKKNVLKSPISHFFISLAQDMRELAIAVVLSGMGSDGALGAESIKNEGGLVIAEEPSAAKYDGMPESAIKTGVVDHILPVEKIPGLIMHYVRDTLPRRKSEEIGMESFKKIFNTLRSVTGHEFSSYKRSTVTRRIQRRMSALKIRSFNDYARYLEKNHAEARVLFKEMLIGVTSFFRDPEAFKVIRQKVLPLLFQKKPETYSFRIWIPACSTGEEAYSLAILMRDFMLEKKLNHTVQVFATDLDEEAIEYCRQGVYPADIAKDVPRDLLKRYFVKKGNFYQVEKSVREMIIFAQQNLIKDPPFMRLDLVSCRNFLIYVDGELQDKLMPLFHYVLKPGGVLILGPSESVGGYMDLFTPLDKRWKVYLKKDTMFVPPPPLNFPFTGRMPPRIPAVELRLKKSGSPAFEEMIDSFLLEKYSPKALVVNGKGDIFYIHGRTGRYLELAPGNAKTNIFEMAREGLKTPLEALVHRASQTKKETVQRDIVVKTNGSRMQVNIIVRPFLEPEMEGLFLVLFEEPLLPLESAGEKKTEDAAITGTRREQELARELHNTRVRLQNTAEEMETSNEELKSANEEYQSTNEELKSANEELETSREEMQSLNEELTTVNAELQGKVDELSQSHRAMKNFLDNLEIPIIVLDNEGRIVRFTADAGKIVNLIETDIGRPLSHISSNLRFPDLVDQAREVIKSLRYKETEVQTKNNRWYLMRILPYKSGKNFVEGVVMIFVDITDLKGLTQKLADINKLKNEKKR